MSDEKIELARSAVACEGWRWMEGMVGIRDSGTKFDGGRHRVTIKTRSTMDNIGWLPDLSDPATLGCLLHLVREAWGDDDISPRYQSGSWFIHTSEHQITASSYVEVLVVALEVAQEAADE